MQKLIQGIDIDQLSELKGQALDSAKFGITIADKSGEFIYVNKEAYVLLGYSSDEELIGRSARILFSTAEIENYMANILPVLLRGENWDGKVNMVKKNGDEFKVRLALKNINNGYKLSIFYDTTQSEKDKLKLSDLSAAVSSTMDGVALLNSAGEYYYLNQKHVSHFGYKREEELLGKTWRQIYPVQEIERIERDIFPKLIKDGRWQGETLGLKKDGSYINQEITLTTLSHGGLICIMRNISEKKQHLNEIKKLALVASKTSNAILITNSNHKLEWVNEAADKVFAIDHCCIGQNVFNFFKDAGMLTQTIDELCQEWPGGQSFYKEFSFLNQNGKQVSLYANISSVVENGDVINYVYLMTDISLIKDAAKNLLNALEQEKTLNEMKSRFVSMASHEFRTPLASIQSSADILQLYLQSADGLKPEKLQVHLAQIAGEVKKMTELMDNVLVLEKMKTGKFDFRLVPTDILPAVNDILNAPQFTTYNKSIKLSVTGSVRDVICDIKLVEHILSNLVCNALKYSLNTPKPIEVKLIFKKEEVIFSVRDYGIGIPAQDQKRLFESFFRAGNSVNIAGTGLGLTIAKQFIEAHMGEIKFKSVEGFGSVFSFNIKG